MELCRHVVNELELPPFAANPLSARAFASNLAVAGGLDL
jgi:Na+(H+)/acetate symporter ActP